jgi:hypothetical protein
MSQIRHLRDAINVLAFAIGGWLVIELGQQLFAPVSYGFTTFDSGVVYRTERRWVLPDRTHRLEARHDPESGAKIWQIQYAPGKWTAAFKEND